MSLPLFFFLLRHLFTFFLATYFIHSGNWNTTPSHIYNLHTTSAETLIETTMYVARVSTRVSLSKQTASHLSKVVAANFSQSCSGSLRRVGPCASPVLPASQPHRQFSSTSRTALRDYFPEPETDLIRKTKPAWEHPEYVLHFQNIPRESRS